MRAVIKPHRFRHEGSSPLVCRATQRGKARAQKSFQLFRVDFGDARKAGQPVCTLPVLGTPEYRKRNFPCQEGEVRPA